MSRRFWLVLLATCSMCLIVGGCNEKTSRRDFLVFGKPPDVIFVNNVPVWRGLMAGKATRENVLSVLGTPEKSWSSGDLEVMRYLPKGYERERHDFNTYYRLILRQGVVQVIDIETWGYGYGELLAEVGQPEQVVEYPRQDDVAIFADRGIAAVVPRPVGEPLVSRLRYYVPTSVGGYMEEWGQFHPEDLPWQSPIPPRVDRLGLIPGITPRQEVESLFGQPDFEWTDKEDKLQLAYYHVPGKTSERFHRFAFQKDILAWMNVEIWEDDFSIDKAIATLGEVETVIRPRQYDVSPPIHYYLWPEKGIVLIAWMKAIYSPIETRVPPTGEYVRPNGADIVVAHVQFEPMSLEAFLEQKWDQRITEEIGHLY